MTTQEAIDRLTRMSTQRAKFVKSSPSHFYGEIYRKDAEALDMAIEALQKQKGDCDTCRWEHGLATQCVGCDENFSHYERYEP